MNIYGKQNVSISKRFNEFLSSFDCGESPVIFNGLVPRRFQKRSQCLNCEEKVSYQFHSL